MGSARTDKVMKLLRHLPNFLTCCNLLSGCLGIVAIWKGWPVGAAVFVWAACVFDFLDGFAARAVGASSPIGKELDSLADMVSFGVLPALTMFAMIEQSTDNNYIPALSLLIAVFSALRLAIFNVDERQKEGFIGLPTPANALFITALVYLPAYFPGFQWNGVSLVIITILFSGLMVAPISLFSLKFKNFAWKDNQVRFTFLLISVLLLVFFREASLPGIIIFYLLISLLNRRSRAV